MMDRSGNMRQRSVLFLLAALISSGAGHAIPSPAPGPLASASDISSSSVAMRARILSFLEVANDALGVLQKLYFEYGVSGNMGNAAKAELGAAIATFNENRLAALTEIRRLLDADGARTTQWLKQERISVSEMAKQVGTMAEAIEVKRIPPSAGADRPALPQENPVGVLEGIANNQKTYQEAETRIKSDLLDYASVQDRLNAIDRSSFSDMDSWAKAQYQGLLQRAENLKSSIMEDFSTMLEYDPIAAFAWQRAQGPDFNFTEYAAYGVASTENVSLNIVSARQNFEAKYLEVVGDVNAINDLIFYRALSIDRVEIEAMLLYGRMIANRRTTLEVNRVKLEEFKVSLKEIDVDAVYFINQYARDHPINRVNDITRRQAIPKQQGVSDDLPFAQSKTSAEINAYRRIALLERRLISLDRGLKEIYNRGLGRLMPRSANRTAYNQLAAEADPLREELALDVEILMRSNSGTGRGSIWEWMDTQGYTWESLYPALDGPSYRGSLGEGNIAPAPVQGVETDFITALRTRILDNVRVNMGKRSTLISEKNGVMAAGKENISAYNRLVNEYNAHWNEYMGVAKEGSDQISELFVKDENAMRWMTKNRVAGDVLFRNRDGVRLDVLSAVGERQSYLNKLLSDINTEISNLYRANTTIAELEAESFGPLNDPGRVVYNRVVAGREKVKESVLELYERLRLRSSDSAQQLLSNRELSLEDLFPSFLSVDEPMLPQNILTAREEFFQAHARVQTSLERFNSLVTTRNRLQILRKSATGKVAETTDMQIQRNNDDIIEVQEQIDGARVNAREKVIDLFKVDENGALNVLSVFRDFRLPKQLASDPAIALAQKHADALGQSGAGGAGEAGGASDGGAADSSYTGVAGNSPFDQLRFEQQGARPRGPRVAAKPRPKLAPRPSRMLARSRGGRSASEGNLVVGDPNPGGASGEYTALPNDPRATASDAPGRSASVRGVRGRVEEFLSDYDYNELQRWQMQDLMESRLSVAEKASLAEARARAQIYQDAVKRSVEVKIQDQQNFETNKNIFALMRKKSFLFRKPLKLLERFLDPNKKSITSSKDLKALNEEIAALPEARIDGDFYSVDFGRNADLIPPEGIAAEDVLFFKQPWVVDNTLREFEIAVNYSEPGDVINLMSIVNAKPGAPGDSAPVAERVVNPRSLFAAATRWQTGETSTTTRPWVQRALQQSQFDGGSAHEVLSAYEFTVKLPAGGTRTVREVRVRPRTRIDTAENVYRMGGGSETHGQRMAPENMAEISEGAYRVIVVDSQNSEYESIVCQ